MTSAFWTAYAVKLGVLALVMTALYAIARRLRNGAFSRQRGRRCIAVIETTMLTPHVSVHVLGVGNQRLLVGAGTAGARTLARWASTGESSDVEVAELRDFVAGALE